MFYPFEMERYLETLLGERDSLLKEMEEQALKETIPVVTPMVGNFLELMVRTGGVQSVLEIGTAIGYSTIWLARGTRETGGHVTTIDMNKGRLAQAKDYIRRSGLEDRVTILKGDARKILPDLKSLYDLVFIDAAKGEYSEYLRMLEPLIAPGGLLVADNVLFRGWVVPGSTFAPKYERIVGDLRRFLHEISQNPKLSTTVLPFGDGVSISRKISS